MNLQKIWKFLLIYTILEKSGDILIFSGHMQSTFVYLTDQHGKKSIIVCETKIVSLTLRLTDFYE